MTYERDKAISLIWRIFRAEDFKWASIKTGKSEVPSIQEIEKTVEELENSALEDGTSSTGRILVTADEGIFEYYVQAS